MCVQIVHDVNHPGHTNDFLVAVEDPLAITYNDTSPLENHHLAAAFNMLRSSEYNFMEEIEHDAFRTLRSLMIELVLATDMKKHFEILSHFQVGPPHRRLSLSHLCVKPIAQRSPSLLYLQ
jgi:hypothetical protein